MCSNEAAIVVMSATQVKESSFSSSTYAEEQSSNDKLDAQSKDSKTEKQDECDSHTFNCSGCADDFEAHPDYFSEGSKIVCGDCLKAEKKT